MNFWEKTLATSKVKRVERKGEISVRMYSCDKLIKKAIVTQKFEQTIPSLTPNSADAAYTFMKQFDETKELFVLTQKDGELGKAVREAISVSKGNPEVNAYAEAKKKGTEQSALQKSFYLAAASLVCAIKAIKDPILGYTLDRELAEKFAHSLDTEHVLDIHDENALKEAWNVAEGLEKSQLLKNILGKDKALIPDSAIFDFAAYSKPPFSTIGWRIIKHQVEIGHPLDLQVYKVVTNSEVYAACLANGTQLEGLDFSGKAQTGILLYAFQNNRNVKTLKDGNVWKSADEMAEIYDRWKSDPNAIDDDKDGLYFGEAYLREKEKREREKAVNQIANTVLDGQIAQLRSQLEVAELDYRNGKITALNLGQIRASIKRQIEDLERKKR